MLTHALEATEAIDGKRYDIVVMLQPTSPLRTAGRCFGHDPHARGWRLGFGVDRVAHRHQGASLEAAHRVRRGALDYYDPRGAEIVARQQLKPVYHRNGIAYAITRDCLLDQRSIKGKRAGALVIEGEHVSIDTEWDLALVEFLLARRAQGEASVQKASIRSAQPGSS